MGRHTFHYPRVPQTPSNLENRRRNFPEFTSRRRQRSKGAVPCFSLVFPPPLCQTCARFPLILENIWQCSGVLWTPSLLLRCPGCLAHVESPRNLLDRVLFSRAVEMLGFARESHPWQVPLSFLFHSHPQQQSSPRDSLLHDPALFWDLTAV